MPRKGNMEEAQAVAVQPAEAPTPAEESAPSQASQGENQSEASGSESQKSVNRYQKLASENKQYRERVERYEKEIKALENAKLLDAALRKDPRNAQFVLDVLQGKIPYANQPQQDPYAQYEPDVAERFRKLDAIERRLVDEDRQRQEAALRSVEENKAHLESVFEKKLQQDGYIQKDGSFNEVEVDLLSDAVLSRATRIAKDPRNITEGELLKAYDYVIKGTQAIEKRGLTRTVKPTPPPSASNVGTAPIGKGKETDEQRLTRITREFDAARGAA